MQGAQPRALPGWCWQGECGLSFLWCGWWGELSTGSPSQWWSHRCCWWKHSLTSLPCPSRWQRAWRCPAFEDLSNKSLETEQRAKWNETETVEIVHLPIASYMHCAASSAPGSLLRWGLCAKSQQAVSSAFSEWCSTASCGCNRAKPLCCGLMLCRCITEQPSLQSGTCSAQQKRQRGYIIAV